MKKLLIIALAILTFSCSKTEEYSSEREKKVQVRFRVKVDEGQQQIYSDFYNTLK